VRGDGGEHLFAVDAEALGFDDEFFDLVAEELGALLAGRVGQRGDDGADAGAGFEQPLGDEVGDDLVRGVGVDLELLGQGADGGEGIAGAQLAGDHRLLGGVDDLLEERDAGAELDAKRDHVCTITDSTAIAQGIFAISWLANVQGERRGGLLCEDDTSTH
jgi:hypothetical protein